MAIPRNAFLRLGLLAALLFVGQAQATPFQVTVDTTNLNGVNAVLGFDLNDGNGTAGDSSVTISGFNPTGLLGGTLPPSGGVSGGPLQTADVTLTDTSGFNEYLQSITLGNTFTFTFTSTGTWNNVGLPDAFSFFVLDSNGLFPIVSTAGLGNALITYDIGVPVPPYLPQPQVYQGLVIVGDEPKDDLPVGVGATAVPEPGALALVMAGLLVLGSLRSVRPVPRRNSLTV